jgi:6-pyruvoyltetrahydropterin/6-carboxytetrahydropterin synthase
MAIIYLTRREVFSASHRLWNQELSDDQNYELYDKCANPNGHGHNFVLEVTIAGPVKEESGFAVDFKKLKHIVRTEIIEKTDHKHLNHDVDFLKGTIPTAENIVRVFWHVLEAHMGESKLYSIRLHETENNMVEYRGEE